MPRRDLWILCTAILLGAATAARAEVSFDIAAGLPLGDDARIFLNVTNSYYAPAPEIGTAVIRRCRYPVDDYPTILLLARASGRPPGAILDLRLGGLAWIEVMQRLRVSPGILFVGMDHDPGPPYGKAWGYWKKNPRGRLRLNDRDFVELAKLRVSSGATHLSPYTILAERRQGVTYERYVADRHRGRGHGAERDARHGEGRGKSHGHGQDSARSHGGGNPHQGRPDQGDGDRDR